VRRLLVLLLAVLVVGGCGSSTPASSSPVSSELSYFPSGSPLVISIATDPNSSAVKGAQALIGRFPLAAFGESALMAKLGQLGINYQNDIRPLFGNPIMLGATGSTLTPTPGSSSYLVVWVTNDAGKLGALIKKLPGIHNVGSHNGATLYQTGATAAIAVDGATAVLGPSTAAVDSALDRHTQGSGISTADYSRAFQGLPQGTLIQAFGSLTGLLSRASAAKARRVPWVAALRAYAATVGVSSAGLMFNYRLDTTGRALTPAEVPFSSSSATPSFAGKLPITAGIKDPAHVVAFAEAAEQAVNPSSYAAFLKRQRAARAKTGVDLNTLLGMLSGDLIISSDTHTTMGRASVSDPVAAARTLSKLIKDPLAISSKARRVSALGGGFYALKGGRTVVIGIVGKQLVAGNASPARLRAFASAAPSPAVGAQGSVAFRVALVELLRIALKQAPPKIAQTILSSLGDITGWISATPSAIIGSATLAVQ
jgi:hypothetical protein